MKDSPSVVIGMPVYNAGDGLRRVLDSIIGQTFTDFILFISDNASSDNTSEICKEYANKDSRIRYVRQDINIGAEANFRYVFSATDSKYFMWAAGDDTRSLDFLELNYEFLKDNPEYLASTCPVRFEGGDFNEVAMGDASLSSDDHFQRILTVFRTWHANGRFYSLFKREAIEGWKYFNNSFFLGADWTLVTHVASNGKFNRASRGWVELGRGGVSNATNVFARYRGRFLDWILPFNQLTWDTLRLMRGASAFQLMVVIFRLARLNFQAFLGQFRVMITRPKGKG